MVQASFSLCSKNSLICVCVCVCMYLHVCYVHMCHTCQYICYCCHTLAGSVPTWGEPAVVGQFLHTILQQDRQDHIIIGELTAE